MSKSATLLDKLNEFSMQYGLCDTQYFNSSYVNYKSFAIKIVGGLPVDHYVSFLKKHFDDSDGAALIKFDMVYPSRAKILIPNIINDDAGDNDDLYKCMQRYKLEFNHTCDKVKNKDVDYLYDVLKTYACYYSYRSFASFRSTIRAIINYCSFAGITRPVWYFDQNFNSMCAMYARGESFYIDDIMEQFTPNPHQSAVVDYIVSVFDNNCGRQNFEKIVLCGKAGCGKTTILKSIMSAMKNNFFPLYVTQKRKLLTTVAANIKSILPKTFCSFMMNCFGINFYDYNKIRNSYWNLNMEHHDIPKIFLEAVDAKAVLAKWMVEYENYYMEYNSTSMPFLHFSESYGHESKNNNCLIFLDEFSMIDYVDYRVFVEFIQYISKCLKLNVVVMIVGDPNQLAPINARYTDNNAKIVKDAHKVFKLTQNMRCKDTKYRKFLDRVLTKSNGEEVIELIKQEYDVDESDLELGIKKRNTVVHNTRKRFATINVEDLRESRFKKMKFTNSLALGDPPPIKELEKARGYLRRTSKLNNSEFTCKLSTVETKPFKRPVYDNPYDLFIVKSNAEMHYLNLSLAVKYYNDDTDKVHFVEYKFYSGGIHDNLTIDSLVSPSWDSRGLAPILPICTQMKYICTVSAGGLDKGTSVTILSYNFVRMILLVIDDQNNIYEMIPTLHEVHAITENYNMYRIMYGEQEYRDKYEGDEYVPHNNYVYNFPIYPANAINCFQSQGVTLESNARVQINLKNFSKEECYVALSRVQSGKQIKNIFIK